MFRPGRNRRSHQAPHTPPAEKRVEPVAQGPVTRTFRATCPVCGDVSLPSHVLHLMVDPDTTQLRSFYTFTCPTCNGEVCTPAGLETVRLLVMGGVDPEMIPAEAFEEHRGPALTYNDVLDFTSWLAGTADIAAVAGRKR